MLLVLVFIQQHNMLVKSEISKMTPVLQWCHFYLSGEKHSNSN